MTNDGFHTYTFDAEGNITAVDAGQTASYLYNALNQRVQTTVGGAVTGYLFNAAGQRVLELVGSLQSGKYYWGARPIAFYAGGSAHFEHQDWLGTERMRTTYNGGVEGAYTSQPWGDGQGTTGSDTDANHYGMLDSDPESGTAHAQFRQYSNAQGRWLAPDLYHGSYKWRNPQSFNRYAYAGNNPLAATDPSGLDPLEDEQSLDGDGRCGQADSIVVCFDGGDGFGGSYGGGSGDSGGSGSGDSGGSSSTSMICNTTDGVNVYCSPELTVTNIPISDQINEEPLETYDLSQNLQSPDPTNVAIQRDIANLNNNLTQISNIWATVEHVGALVLGVGTMASGVLGTAAACVGGGPLLCGAAVMIAPAFIVGGYYTTTSSWKELNK